MITKDNIVQWTLSAGLAVVSGYGTSMYNAGKHEQRLAEVERKVQVVERIATDVAVIRERVDNIKEELHALRTR